MTLKAMKRLLVVFFVLAATGCASLIEDTRTLINRGDFAGAEAHIRSYQARNGVTPESLEAYSWLGRGYLAAGKLVQAEEYAARAEQLVLQHLKKTGSVLDAEPHLPIALGAALEVQAQVRAAQGERAAAVDYLRTQLKQYFKTSIRTRIQKNLNLLSLEGKPAPALDVSEYLGAVPKPLSAYKGRPVLLFFWAHWCATCKSQIPVVRRLMDEYGPKGLVLVGPTQRYGYGSRGANLSPAAELKYIDEVRQRVYAPLEGMAVPVSEENFSRYGASTTPTLVLVDGGGIVRLYRPGPMGYEELRARIGTVLR